MLRFTKHNSLSKAKLLIVLIFWSGIIYGQNLGNFETLKPKGKLPLDFRQTSFEKYEEAFNSNIDKKLDEEFFLDSRFFLDKLLLNGNFLFNEFCSEYVREVATYVLKANHKEILLKELRFYVLKSSISNAFSTDQGIIVVTTGLLARVENEAQLAFVLAHEISHFTDKHVQNSYKETEEIKKGTDKYERNSYNAQIAGLSAYSRGQELIADELGIELMLNTEYSTEELFSTFEMLLYSYLPFKDKTVPDTFLNQGQLQIPSYLFDCDIKDIIRSEDDDDQNSSHPNIKNRMDALFSVLNEDNSKGSLQFKISEEKFNKVQTLARFEELNILLAERRYAEVLYESFLLEMEFPNNNFIALCKSKALYGLAKYKNNDRIEEVLLAYDDSEGEISRICYFLENCPKPALNVIAYRHIYDAYKTQKLEILKMYENDMLNELANNSDLDLEMLQPLTFEEYSKIKEVGLEFDVDDSLKKIDATDLSKYEKIKLKKELRSLGLDFSNNYHYDDDFFFFALNDLVVNYQLVEKLKTAKKKNNSNVEPKNTDFAFNQKSGLHVNKIVIVDPIFEMYNGNAHRMHIESEKMKIETGDSYTKNYPKLDLERHVIDSKNLGEDDVETYAHIGVLFQWVMEVIDHKGIDMITSNHDQMVILSKFYNTPHFIFTGVLVYKDKSKLFTRNFTELTAFSVNAETDGLEYAQSNLVKSRLKGLQLESYIFEILYNLNQ